MADCQVSKQQFYGKMLLLKSQLTSIWKTASQLLLSESLSSSKGKDWTGQS